MILYTITYKKQKNNSKFKNKFNSFKKMQQSKSIKIAEAYGNKVILFYGDSGQIVLGNYFKQDITFLLTVEKKPLKLTFKCAEALYQAFKFVHDKNAVTKLCNMYGHEAWTFGNDSRNNPKKIENTNDVMIKILRTKFEKNSENAKLLINTGNLAIIEHKPTPKKNEYWTDGCDGSGKNMLGQLLMIVRYELINKTMLDYSTLINTKQTTIEQLNNYGVTQNDYNLMLNVFNKNYNSLHNNSQNNNHQYSNSQTNTSVHYCCNCNSKPANKNHSWCQSCFLKSKGICTNCENQKANNNHNWCKSCYANSQKSHSNNLQISHSNNSQKIHSNNSKNTNYIQCCSNCKTNPANKNHNWCQSCFLKSKGICTKCAKTTANKNRSWCQSCYVKNSN
jgi:N-glycosidase YbiA